MVFCQLAFICMMNHVERNASFNLYQRGRLFKMQHELDTPEIEIHISFSRIEEMC